MAGKQRSDAPSVSRIKARFISPWPTADADGMRRTLSTLQQHERLRASHGSVDERKRTPFDLETLSNPARPLVLWRLSAPAWEGTVASQPRPYSGLSLSYEAPLADSVPTIWSELLTLGNELRPVFGFVHLALQPIKKKAQDASWAGFSTKLFDFFDFGPPGCFAASWYGPELSAMIGADRLAAVGAEPRRDGSSRIVLHPTPWTLTGDELFDLQSRANGVLGASGVLGDYQSRPPEPGAKWKPIPRKAGP